MEFEGFPTELPDFMWGLALNNEKSWFEAHREQYERCLHRPFTALARDVGAAMEQRWPGTASAVHISRIYRDARRLHGRGPYKDHLWFSLGQSGELYVPRPKFWFEIGAAECSYGMGYFLVGPGSGEVLRRWRESIDADPRPVTKLVRAFEKQQTFTCWGELYKRPKGDPGPLLFDWYNRRELGFSHQLWFDRDPPGAELVQQITEDFALLVPFYRYFCERV